MNTVLYLFFRIYHLSIFSQFYEFAKNNTTKNSIKSTIWKWKTSIYVNHMIFLQITLLVVETMQFTLHYITILWINNFDICTIHIYNKKARNLQINLKIYSWNLFYCLIGMYICPWFEHHYISVFLKKICLTFLIIKIPYIEFFYKPLAWNVWCIINKKIGRIGIKNLAFDFCHKNAEA